MSEGVIARVSDGVNVSVSVSVGEREREAVAEERKRRKEKSLPKSNRKGEEGREKREGDGEKGAEAGTWRRAAIVTRCERKAETKAWGTWSTK